MEMYSLQWALAVMYVIGGPLLGLFLPFIAIPLAVYSFFTRKYRRGVVGSRVALGFAVAPLLFTVVMWYELIAGKFINGESVNYRDDEFTMYKFVAVLETIALAASIVSWIRQRLRRQEAVAVVRTASPPPS
jgi:hypothetical protein